MNNAEKLLSSGWGKDICNVEIKVEEIKESKKSTETTLERFKRYFDDTVLFLKRITLTEIPDGQNKNKSN